MTRQMAAGMILLGAACMSFTGLLLRLLDDAGNYQIMVYRCIGICLAVVIIACLRRKISPQVFLRSLSGHDVIMGLFLCIAFSFYVYSIMITSVANTLFILSASPFFAAIIGWIWIGERPGFLTWASMALASAGVLLMVVDGINGGRLAGNLFALGSALAFSFMLVFVRWTKREDVLGGTFLGGFFALLLNIGLAVTIGSGLAISGYDMALCIFMGLFSIGAGMTLVTWGAAFLPAAEVSILVLFESVIGPAWVWLFLGETSSSLVMTGGAIVLTAVVLQAAGRMNRRAATVSHSQ